MDREPDNETSVEAPVEPEGSPEAKADAPPEKRPFIPEELRIRKLRMLVRLLLLAAIFVIGLWSITQLQRQLYYYDQLMMRCVQLKDRSCCWASVRAMREGNFKLVRPENDWRKQCPKGEAPHTLRCDSSYQWCAPTD
jgi:hypothetical protein